MTVMKDRKTDQRSRTMLSCIAVGKYYDAIDYLKFAGADQDERSVRLRERGERAESVMREAVAEFERSYGEPKRRDDFPHHVWECCHQPLNVRQFDMAWQASLRKAA
jgi:hypothetical protein